MRSLLTTLSTIFLILFFISCGPSNTVEVESFSPTGEVQNLTNFTIEFSENLAPADVQDKWLDEEFVTFTPAIQGKFKWTSPSTLIFFPMHRFIQCSLMKQQLIKMFYSKRLSLRILKK